MQGEEDRVGRGGGLWSLGTVNAKSPSTRARPSASGPRTLHGEEDWNISEHCQGTDTVEVVVAATSGPWF